MLRKTIGLSVAALLVAGAALAGPNKSKKPKAAPIEVTTCPIMGSNAAKAKAKTVTVAGKKYNVHFCCAGCPEKFSKLSRTEQKAKIQQAIEKSKAAADASATAKTVVMTCPMTGEAVKGAGGGTELVGNYEVHFCCAGCKPAFDKLSASDKEAKIKTALAK